MIKLLIAIFIIIMLILAVLLITTKDHPFIAVKQENLPQLKKVALITATFLLLVSLLGIILLIWAPLNWNLVTLVIGSLIVGGFSLIVVQLDK